MAKHKFLVSSLLTSYSASGSHRQKLSTISTDPLYVNSKPFDLVFDALRNYSKIGKIFAQHNIATQI